VAAPDERLAGAIALREAGRSEQARPLLVALAADFPNDAQVQYQAGWVHDLLGLEPEAVPYYERALALGLPDADRPGLLLSLGSTYRNVGRHADAVATLLRGVHDYPADSAMRCFLALAQHSAGEINEALALALDVVLADCPSSAIERYRRALTWYRDELRGSE